MGKKNIYILMYKDYEVLSFSVDFRKSRTTFLKKLEHFDKAPYSVQGSDEDINNRLFRFFNGRTIPRQRNGYNKIIKACHCRNGFNLAFKGHGLSLSNHYWFKKPGEMLRYDDINFFTNKWDDSFARALIREDYEALAKADLNVPDIVTAGWGVKGWIYDPKKGPRLFKIGIHRDSADESITECLASRLAQRLFKKEEVLQYDLEKIYGRYASVSSPMIGVDEDLFPLSIYLPGELYLLYRSIRSDKNLYTKFFVKLKEFGNHEIYIFFVKLICLKSLCFVNDLHFDNISITKNIKTGEIKLAPLYDLGGAFGSSQTAKKIIEKPSKTTLLLIYFLYSCLDPDWDYSWYDKEKLVGFEDEIRDFLSKSDFYKPELIDFAVEIYKQQKASLDEMAEKNK